MVAEGLQKRNYIHVSPALVNSKYSLTKQESNIVLLLLTIIDKDDEDFKDYIFTKSDLEKRTGVKLNSLKLKNLAKGLMSKVLEVPTPEGFKLFTWFSYFEYENGIITCCFDKRMKKYLIELHQYILINAPQLLMMKSNYSRRIYMLLKERAKFGTRTFNVDELQDLLAVPTSYKLYSKFKQSVLTNAVKEINKHTDLEIEFEEEKPVRKVTEIIFSIKKNHNDLKAFIKIIREAYTNTPLYTNKGRTLQCSDKGLLYYADAPMEWINKEKSQNIWEWLHEHREALLCFIVSTKDENTIQKNIEKMIAESLQNKIGDEFYHPISDKNIKIFNIEEEDGKICVTDSTNQTYNFKNIEQLNNGISIAVGKNRKEGK